MLDGLFIFGELALIVICGLYAVEIIERLWKPKIGVPSQEWRDMVDPIVKKCRLSATFGGNTQFNSDGSNALADLLDKMARELDRRS